MRKGFFNLELLSFAALCGLILCHQLNAQTKETLIKKLPDGTEIYQRREETTAVYDYPNLSETTDSGVGKMEKRDFAVQKLEVLLRNPTLNQEEIIWSQILKFPKNERAFNYFVVWDVSGKDGKYHVLYFRELELKVETTVKDSGKWSAENETFLESTSESINPITEARFIGKNRKFLQKEITTISNGKFTNGSSRMESGF